MSARHGTRPGALGAVLALVLSLLVTGVAAAPPAAAAVAADFDPGNIISDQVFFDPSTMNVAQVQAFLDARGASCVAGEQPCLKDYRTATTTRAAEPGLCRGWTGAPNQSAAEIVVGVASSCGINPRVLLVLLEKENSLVTRSRPTTRSYQAATGYACPDTAPCDVQYYGLFNQLYMAARQYQNYAQNPTRFGYVAGRVNTVRWHPDAACGTSQLYIANQATAGLYNYTPYRPNAAALANLYGTGDACSSYGNRNFWRLYTDWFGSTQSTNGLVRTPESATVYLVSGTTKYPIASLDVMLALSPTGTVGFVSQQYLDRRATGRVVQRSLLGPDGTVYFFDAGIRLSFGSCGQVADYGMSCADLVRVDAATISSLVSGPSMPNLYRTTTGKTFWVTGGTRREVVDDESLTAAGLPLTSVTLTEQGIAYLPYGAPVARDGVVVTSRSGGDPALVTGGAVTPLPADLGSTPGLAALPRRPLDAASLARATTTAPLAPVVKEPTGSRVYLLTTAGKVLLDDTTALGATTATAPVGLLERLPDAGRAVAPVMVKGQDATIYLLRAGELRAVRSWGDLVAINGGNGSPRFDTLAGRSVDLLPKGPLQVAPATLMVAQGDGTVYLSDGLDARIAVGSFAVTDQLGATALIWLNSADLTRYAPRPGTVSTSLRCGGTTYLGMGGRLYPASDAMVTAFGLRSPTPVEPVTCAALPQAGRPLERFLREPNGTIYLMENGLKRPIGSWQRYVAAGGTSANTIDVTAATTGWFATGAPY